MPMQSDLRFRLAVPDGPDLDVVRFELEESVSQPFRLELDLSSFNDAIDTNTLLDHEATFTIERDGIAERTVVGIVTAFETDETGFQRTRYRAVVESTSSTTRCWNCAAACSSRGGGWLRCCR
ncbi:contractile injection system protein, VgrG/Pvc8 family [Lysobacter sp. FW306-1B-D06B]|uniref:contractile injection system protein, VgrG/Pvc8 family n=1 Tax=Lysobacter sp. FW306-1B-D06B TaxID=3140250 RepID=UPI00314098D1